jgi:hypothetical protein
MTPNDVSSKEEKSIFRPGSTANPHNLYLFKEKKANKVLDEFKFLLENGYTGMYITRTPPRLILEQFKGAKCSVVWLTGNKVQEHNTLAPNEISRLASIIMKFLSPDGNEPITNEEALPKRAILLDNLEYLILQNNFQIILRILHMVRDKIMLYPGVMLIPVDPMTFDFKDLRLIERECEVIDLKDY